MRKITSKLIIITILMFSGCTGSRVSTIVGCNFDASTNQTKFIELPYGSVLIPGKWEKSGYNSISGQSFLTNPDSVRIAIALNQYDKYEFNTDGSKRGYSFALRFYEWDSGFFADTYGIKSRIIESDSTHNYILYQLYGMAKGAEYDALFLIGENNGIVKNLSVMTTNKWTEERKIGFLKEIYLNEQDTDSP